MTVDTVGSMEIQSLPHQERIRKGQGIPLELQGHSHPQEKEGLYETQRGGNHLELGRGGSAGRREITGAECKDPTWCPRSPQHIEKVRLLFPAQNGRTVY